MAATAKAVPDELRRWWETFSNGFTVGEVDGEGEDAEVDSGSDSESVVAEEAEQNAGGAVADDSDDKISTADARVEELLSAARHHEEEDEEEGVPGDGYVAGQLSGREREATTTHAEPWATRAEIPDEKGGYTADDSHAQISGGLLQEMKREATATHGKLQRTAAGNEIHDKQCSRYKGGHQVAEEGEENAGVEASERDGKITAAVQASVEELRSGGAIDRHCDGEYTAEDSYAQIGDGVLQGRKREATATPGKLQLTTTGTKTHDKKCSWYKEDHQVAEEEEENAGVAASVRDCKMTVVAQAPIEEPSSGVAADHHCNGEYIAQDSYADIAGGLLQGRKRKATSTPGKLQPTTTGSEVHDKTCSGYKEDHQVAMEEENAGLSASESNGKMLVEEPSSGGTADHHRDEEYVSEDGYVQLQGGLLGRKRKAIATHAELRTTGKNTQDEKGDSNMPGGGRSRGGGGALVKKATKKLRGISSILRGDARPSGSTSRPSSSTSRRRPSPPPSPPPPSRHGRGRQAPSPPPVEEPVEEPAEEEEDEHGHEHEEDEDEEEEHEEVVPDYEEEEGDDRIWEPPEEYVEPKGTGMPREPGPRKVYQRGVAGLPELDEWEAMGGVVTLTPSGDRSFVYKEGYRVRTYASILGCLVRKHFPGIVTMPNGRTEVAWTWAHYKHAPDPEGTTEAHLQNCQSRVMYDFWRYFTPDPDFRKKDCTTVAAKIAQKKVTDSHYEGRILSIRNWYAEKGKLRISKDEARERLDLQPWQYMQCPPPYVGKSGPQVWSAMVRHYTSKAYKKTHEEGKLKRAAMGGGSHTQGSIPLSVCKQVKGKELGADPSLFKIWGDKRKKKDKKDGTMKWVSQIAEVKDDKYRAKFAEKHGVLVNPDTEPFDPEVAMLAGEGRKHGLLWLCDGAVDSGTVDSGTVPTVREIRRGSTSSSPAFEVRPTASSIAIDSIRAELETERRQREQAEAQMLQHQQMMMQQQQMMMQQQQMLAWMSQKMAAYDAHLSASLSSGVTLPRVDPPPFDLNTWLQALAGSNNAELGGPSTQDETMQKLPTGAP